MSTSITEFATPESDSGEQRAVTSILVPSLILIGSQLPLALIYFWNLSLSRPHYQLYPLALIAVAILLVRRWPRGKETPFFPSFFSLALLVVGVFLAVCGTLWLSPWFGFAAMLALIASLLARTNDRRQFGTLISLAAPLLVLLQPPAGIDFDNVQGDIQLMQWVNTNSTALASDLFDVLGLLNMGYIHVVSGSRIELPGGFLDSIDVGTRGTSVFTILIATAIYVAILRRPVFRGLILLMCSVFWAIFGEALQLAICTAGALSFDMDLLGGAAPWSIRIFCLLVAFVLTLLTDHLITFLFGKIDITAIDEDAKFQYWLCQTWNFVIAGVETPVIDINVRREVNWAKWRNSSPSAIVSRVLWVCAIACAVLTVMQVIETGRAGSLAGNHAMQSANRQWIELSDQALPQSLAGAGMSGSRFDNPVPKTAFRVRENVWEYVDTESPDIVYQISVSQTWPGWHDALANHERFQWIPDSTSPVGNIMNSGIVPNLPIVVANFHNTRAEHSFLAFCQFDAFGEPFEPPVTWEDTTSFWRRANYRMNRRIRPRLLVPDALAIQIQVRTVGPLPEPVRRRALQLLEAAAVEIQRQLVAGSLPLNEPDDGQNRNARRRSVPTFPVAQAESAFTSITLVSQSP